MKVQKVVYDGKWLKLEGKSPPIGCVRAVSDGVHYVPYVAAGEHLKPLLMVMSEEEAIEAVIKELDLDVEVEYIHC